MPLRFALVIHNHQPVGNFDFVFEQVYRDGYRPFLELLREYPEVRFTLHTSGPLLEWLVARQPEYIDLLRQMVDQGQVEILGGAFYEPILGMIPRWDRHGQITTFTSYLEQQFGCRVQGAWLAERVWEQELVTDLAEAGIDYTILDDYHFKQAGLGTDQLFGYYLSEDQGQLLRVFPNSEPLRYLVPWKDPEETIGYLGRVAAERPEAVVVCADDGEKFGGWPGTHQHCYDNGWLRRLLDQLRENRHWIQPCTLSQVIAESPPCGTVYLPDCSYREMTEWALPVPRLQSYLGLIRSLEHDPRKEHIQGFLRGGFWRNFLVKYPEVREMYCRMLEVSQRLHAMPAASQGFDSARRELYRGQCNCSYWHGAFGGVYLPHLRHAVYQHLIAADNEVSLSPNDSASVPDVEERDFNLDAAPEVRLGNQALVAYVAPHQGGCIYELDLRSIRLNLLATMTRRPEVYHDLIRQAAAGVETPTEVRFKQPDLDRMLQYDPHPRKSLVDHFYDPEVVLRDVASLQAEERGDFAVGTYQHELKRSGREAQLYLCRSGVVGDEIIRLTKVVSLDNQESGLKVRYSLADLPPDRPVHLAIEFNFAGLAPGQEDRYFVLPDGSRPGQVETEQELAELTSFGLVDEYLGLAVRLEMSRPAGVWAFPIYTVNQSEGGFELVYQSTVVMPHWLISAGASRQWDVIISLDLDTSRAESKHRDLAAATV